MAYKKIFFVFILFFIVSCYDSSVSSFFDEKKTIEIGKFSEVVNIPKRSISLDFKKNIEDYIMKHNPHNLVIKNGDVVLEGIFLNYAIIPIENYPLKKIKVTAKIYYIDNLEPEKNWEKCFVVSEEFYNKKNFFSKEIIDKIISKLTVQVYRKIFYDYKNTIIIE
ncbi:hypothetical protein [Blattabacterium sp. (Blaberus giganteus)]|uniref:hypothetical protein n=1 Tax=Blattabacterium sp. (Blaberus giganteus) TaxID=1186051 RepID=UPI00025F6FAF|nr:hypothetical protein [Blattabacterium sp. (Blaberus giganteus)]AFJ90859.1 hypothetical protein BGIGA_421 [Blattabacterium sp. (Blaberus giganteus)]